MAMVRFDPWKSKYKRPFGAVAVDEFAHFCLEVIDPAVKKVCLVMHKDFAAEQVYKMTDQGDGVFTCDYFFNQGIGLYFYHFEIQTETQTEYFGKTAIGGPGKLCAQQADVWDYQVTCCQKGDQAPDWYREGIFYQIFPDRFANGNEDGHINSPKKNSFLYATQEDEPLYIKDDKGEILRWDFFGGNFKGIQAKIPYLKELGINCLYLNPIFTANSNHRYDTADYFTVDPVLGTETDFRHLLEELHKNDMHLILDGVFSHVGRHSRYFNIDQAYGRYTGAYNDSKSPYYSWFTFKDYPDDYSSWWGIKDLPEVNKDDPNYQQFIYGRKDSVLSKWNQLGVDGWRLDVADELPDDFIKGIRANLADFPDRILLGEVWEDASNKISYQKRRNYILGSHLQGVMNYPLRTSVLNLLNEKKSPQDVAHFLMTLYENYPHDIFYNNLNNIGTHDTERIFSQLGSHIQKLDLAFAMLFVFPGVPCLYYGDEAGLTGGKDPENRKFFPWHSINENIYDNCKKWIQFRNGNEVLKDGKLSFFYTAHLFGILRYDENDYVALLLNPTNYPATCNGDLHYMCDETPMLDEIRQRMSDRTLKENSYLLVTSEQKRKSIELYQSLKQ